MSEKQRQIEESVGAVQDKELGRSVPEEAAALPDNGKESGDEDLNLNPHRWIILIAMMLGAFFQVLDSSSVVPALPKMMGNLGAAPDEIDWVGTGYILSTVIVLPMTAWLSRHFGRKNYLLASIGIFTCASMMCGLSDTLATVVFWRIVQGAGGAALVSIGQSTVIEVFPKKQVVLVQALFSLGIMVAPTVGPAFGGWMVDNYSWNWIFLTKFPVGILTAYLVWKYLHDSPHKNASTAIDWAGIGFLAVGLGSLQYVLEEGQRYDWFDDAWITRITLIAVAGLVVFVIWQLWPSNTAPIVDLRVLRDRGLAVGVVLNVLLGFALYSAAYLFPMFVQGILGFTPTESGLVMMPGGIMTGISLLLSGRLIQKGVDPRHLILIGIPIVVASMWLMGHLSSQSGADDAQFGLLVRGFGLGFVTTPITIAAFAGLRGRQVASGAALLNLCRQLGGSFGIAVLNSYVNDMATFHRTTLVSYISRTDQTFTTRLAGMSAALASKGLGHVGGQIAALGIVKNIVEGQALTMAYDDAYLLVGIVFLAIWPAVFLFKKRDLS
ncbi:MAG: DHA2 family efflux MFS transporter permease subunit [Capsulimonadaceae bacterium]|nr:DHA2 family efflux MFS transporter permease subunit [Capsulimonadaceae bacterium]